MQGHERQGTRFESALTATITATIAVTLALFLPGATADNPRIGDVNCDGLVDFDDINPFVAVLSGGAGAHTGPIDYWPLDGLGRDYGSLQNHGTLEGETTYTDDVPGGVGIGKSCYFDGAGDYVYLGTKFLPEGQFDQFSLQCWFRTDVASSDPYWGHWTVFAFETLDGEFAVTIDTATQRLGATIYTVAEGAQTLWGPVVTDDVWHQVMFCKDDSTIRLFVDDIQVDMAGATGPLQVNGDWHATIGCKFTDDPAHFFGGWIDEVYLYDRPLPYTPPCTGTVGVGNNPSSMAISHGGDTVYVSCHPAHAVYELDTATCSVGDPIDVGMLTSGIAVSDDDQRFYVTAYENGGNPGQLKVYDANTNIAISAAEAGMAPCAVALSRDGRRAYVSNHVSDTLSVINIDEDDLSGYCTEIIELQVAPAGSQFGGHVVVSPDGGTVYVATGGPAGHVTVISADTTTDTYAILCATPNVYMGGIIALSPLQGKVYAASPTELLWINTAEICAGAEWQSSLLATCGGPTGIGLSPDESRLYIACEDADLVLALDAVTLEVLEEIPVGDGPGIVVCHPYYLDGSLIYVSLGLADAVQILNLDE